ncbi:hypothetical protein J7W08_07225 [Methanococcoides orientis]|uniref:hypothetical protein n=1 Tax=Methanococcoides orientis TaxID=2822137 RepID=UPI001E2E313A|nr:hypothetical protein [Methanococcoides orientis]UGV39913.1 hypothetical protein J7W08_07225 [Methanococcoides orientis]
MTYIEDIEISDSPKIHAEIYLQNVEITERYRTQLFQWVETYLDENTLENIIAYKKSTDWDHPFESIRSEAEKDLELTTLYASRGEQYNIDLMVFEGNLLVLFYEVLSKAKEHLNKKIVAH